MWHVDSGEGETEEHTSREKAEAPADAVVEAEERTVVVEAYRPRRNADQRGQIRPRSSRWLLRPPGRELCRTTAKTRPLPEAPVLGRVRVTVTGTTSTG
jgi:hypothetical protein